MYEEKDLDKLQLIQWRVTIMGQNGALVLPGEGKEQELMQSGVEMAVGEIHRVLKSKEKEISQKY